MSRKPTIKISYPDASDVAMKLTEAMVRRAPGRRVVETSSEDSASPAGGELFADFDACSTSTSVDLTLTLNSASMDYALETLIRPNLTADERKRILGEDAEQTELALTPGEQEKKIEIGKIPDKTLREILVKMLINYETSDPDSTEPIDIAINEMNHAAGVIDLDETCEKEMSTDHDLTQKIATVLDIITKRIIDTQELKALENFTSALRASLVDDDKEMQDTYIRIGDLRKELIHARYFGGADAYKRYAELQEEINPNTGIPWSEYEAYELRENKMEPPPHEKIAAAAQEREKQKKAKKSRKKKQEPSWDDVKKEARSMGKKQDQDIEPGLLNDIENGEEGGA